MASSSSVAVRFNGLADAKLALAELTPRELRKVLRLALTAGGRLVRNAARARAPVIAANARAVRRGLRKPGTLRKALSVRTSKVLRRHGDVGVFVNVRPAKGGQRGAKSPNDPYYWRWQNFGRRKPSGGRTRAARFLEAGAAVLPAALTEIEQQLAPQLRKLNQRFVAGR
jgi:hypothetical protein